MRRQSDSTTSRKAPSHTGFRLVSFSHHLSFFIKVSHPSTSGSLQRLGASSEPVGLHPHAETEQQYFTRNTLLLDRCQRSLQRRLVVGFDRMVGFHQRLSKEYPCSFPRCKRTIYAYSTSHNLNYWKEATHFHCIHRTKNRPSRF